MMDSELAIGSVHTCSGNREVRNNLSLKERDSEAHAMLIDVMNGACRGRQSDRPCCKAPSSCCK